MDPYESRQKHLYDYAIDAQGNWFCEGNPVTDHELFRLLSRSLFERDGRCFIRCEGETHPIRVADAPLWVRYVHVEADSQGALKQVDIELRDGRKEPLIAETLTLVGDSALYCLSTRRRLKTRFGKVAYYELARYIRMDEENARFYLVVDGRRYDIREETEGTAFVRDR